MLQQKDVENQTTVREAVWEFLRSCGVTKIFGNPGSTELPMFRNFPTDLDYVLSLQESVAVAMADGHAQATGLPSVVNLHSAAGVGHAMGSLFSAMRNQSPVVIIAGQQARSMFLQYPLLFSERASELPQPYVKWSAEPSRAQDVPEAIARAVRIAMQPPFGPTFVSVPMDDWDQPCAPVAPRQIRSQALPEPDSVAELSQALGQASRIALVVGPGIARDDAWAETVALAERHAAAVFSAFPSSRAVFPEDHPLFAGFLGGAREGVRATLADFDLVVALGAPVFTFHFEGQLGVTAPGASLFQVTHDPTEAVAAITGTSIVANLKYTLRHLLDVSAEPRPMPAKPLRTLPPVDFTTLNEGALAARIAELRPADSAIVLEAPSTSPAVQHYLPVLAPQSFFQCASGGLGWGMPASVGVALGGSGRRAIAILGDGSSMYGIQSLWSAAETGAPVTFIVIRNGGYVVLENIAHYLGFNDPVGCSLGHLDYASLARGQGVEAWTVSDPDTLTEVLAKAFAASGPNLIEVQVARPPNGG